MISVLPLLRRLSPRLRPGSWEAATDVELALAARARDRAGKEAFVEVVRRHQTAVAAVAFSVTGRIGFTDDIAQETFLRAWKRIATLREPAKLKAWLTKIAHDCAVDALRREKPHASLDDERTHLVETAESSPDKSMADAEDERLVWSALAELPETVRTPLVLFYREGQSVASVAASLDLSEDAVKQRLSRGRDALREQVAEKIEGVLSRVKPNPLLTMTVASAIGLAATPEAVAAGAVSGKTAGGSASSWLAAAAALAVGVPLGWKAHEPAAISSSPASAAAQARGPLAEFADGALLREWRRLHELHGTDAAAMPVIYDAIQALTRDFHRRALRRALLDEWAFLDPGGGLSALLEKKQNDHAAVLMHEWLRRDPDQAAAALELHAANASGELARSLLVDVAELAADHLAPIADRIPPPKGSFYSEVQAAFTIRAAKNPEAARLAAEGMSSGQRRGALAGVAAGWAQRDGAAALAWSLTLPKKKGREEASRAAITGWAKSDPIAALDHMKDVPPDYREDYRAGVMKTAVQQNLEGVLNWLPGNSDRMNSSELWDQLAEPLMVRFHTDQSGLLRWVGQQPEKVRKGLIMALATGTGVSSEADQVALWSWMDTLPNGTRQERYLQREMREWIFGRCGPRLEALAFAWMKTLPQDEWESRSFIESHLEGMSRHASRVEALPGAPTLEEVAADFPAALRPGFYSALLKNKTDWNDAELTKWTQRIAEVPEMDRARLAASTAESIVRVSPETAAAWAMELPGDEERLAAVRAVAGKWSAADTAAASTWVSELPAGKGRDVAAATLVAHIASSDPEAAWTWTLSIDSTWERQSSARSVLAAMRKKDPERARQLVQSPDMDESLRTWLKREFPDPPVKKPEAEKEEEEEEEEKEQ